MHVLFLSGNFSRKKEEPKQKTEKAKKKILKAEQTEDKTLPSLLLIIKEKIKYNFIIKHSYII